MNYLIKETSYLLLDCVYLLNSLKLCRFKALLSQVYDLMIAC